MNLLWRKTSMLFWTSAVPNPHGVLASVATEFTEFSFHCTQYSRVVLLKSYLVWRIAESGYLISSICNIITSLTHWREVMPLTTTSDFSSVYWYDYADLTKKYKAKHDEQKELASNLRYFLKMYIQWLWYQLIEQKSLWPAIFFFRLDANSKHLRNVSNTILIVPGGPFWTGN